MTARWPDPDRATIDQYVASLDLRSMKSQTCYRQVLHGFQDVVERYEALNQEVLLAWLRESAIRRAPSTLLHRTRIIDRFLERLVEIGAIERNPVVALRDECNIKQCMPIWRALASRDPERALVNCANPGRSAACWAK
jgi:integrase/recombinase XerD